MSLPASFHRYATPLTAGLFLVATVSGVALFFHVGQQYFHEMHEWLSMVLLVPFAVHLWKNWTPLVNYLRRGWLLVPLAASIVVAIAFAAPEAMSSGGPGGNPGFLAMRLVTGAKLSAVAPLVQTNGDDLAALLKAKGYKVASTDATLDDIARASGEETGAVLRAVMAP